MKIQKLSEILNADDYQRILEIEEDLRMNQSGEFCKRFGRFWVYGEPFLEWLHQTIMLEKAKKLWGEDIIPSYSGLSLYEENIGKCPPHFDRPQCRYSIDLCVKQNEVWPIYVNGKPFHLHENEALIYSGTHDFHWRDNISPGNKVTMAFFHFVDSNFKGELR